MDPAALPRVLCEQLRHNMPPRRISLSEEVSALGMQGEAMHIVATLDHGTDASDLRDLRNVKAKDFDACCTLFGIRRGIHPLYPFSRS
jgi:thioesterase domain-containing protein